MLSNSRHPQHLSKKHMSSQHYSSMLSLLRLHNEVLTKRSDTLTARRQLVNNKTLRQAKTMSSATMISFATPI
jgi:hypothetical protein